MRQSTLMKRTCLFAVLLFNALLTNICIAAVVVTAVETDGNVVFTTADGGSIDLAGLIFGGSSVTPSVVSPSIAAFVIGSPDFLTPVDIYTGLTGPDNFGSAIVNIASFAMGDTFGVGGSGTSMNVPFGYTSGSSLSGTATYIGHTFATLGMTEGTYVWEWSGDSLTLNVGAVVPLPAAVWLFGSAVGFLSWFRLRKSA